MATCYLSFLVKRFLRATLSLLIIVGLVVAAWPVGQNALGRWNQNRLQQEWAQAATTPARTTIRNAAPVRAEIEATPAPIAPWPLVRLVIPEISLDAVVVQGVEDADLRRGPGHLPESGAPGEGNCVLAGHRNVYGSPFARLNELNSGALILLRAPHRTWRYRMSDISATTDTDLSVLEPPAPDSPPVLTLLTCTVPHSWQRIVLTAQQEASDDQ